MYIAVYHPMIVIEETVTRFGAVETNVPNLYQTPIRNKSVYRVDTLYAIIEDWGEVVYKMREYSYMLLSGNCNDYVYHKILQYFYKDFEKFRGYVNVQSLMGDRDVSELYRLIHPVREKVDSYYSDVLLKLKSVSAKVVMHTHDYVYFVLPASTQINLNIVGLEKVS